jgi:hypothetical protein
MTDQQRVDGSGAPEATLTREDVVWCYNALLYREPESEDVVQHYLANFGDRTSLARFFVRTPEFRDRIVAPADLPDFSYTDVEEVQAPALRVLRALTPRKAVGLEKIRVGRDFDGGYVMLDDFAGIRAAYSLGIGDDVSWDIDVADRGIDLYQYDHTIDSMPRWHPRFHWYQYGISASPSERFVTLPRALADHGHSEQDELLLKCDIEGAEWAVLAAMKPEELRPFRQIVMELHGFQMLDRPDFRARAERAVATLTANHTVVHVHANNNSAYSIVGAVPVPAAMEITLVRSDAASLVPNDQTFPTSLDMPSNPHRADFCLGLFTF